MILTQLFENPLFILIWLSSLIVAVTVHEAAHAYVADKLGDPTPRLMGRVTLNPLAHLDPVGTVALLLVGFGWGKPVLFDPFNLQNVKRDTMLISLAGPASNIIIVLLLILLAKFSLIPLAIGIIVIHLNLILAFFNLIPIHPLDGFKIVGGLLPKEYEEAWADTAQYGIFFLILILLPIVGGQSMVSHILDPLITGVMSILL